MKTLQIFGIKVVLTRFGAAIYSQDREIRQSIIKYLYDEGYMNYYSGNFI
jgi:hypothetical protein